ncbi:MAG: hypothetical protein IKN78_12375 [Bacteroidales bacterium]|nr:hypothetical protein [Bacteroidales bacterium]
MKKILLLSTILLTTLWGSVYAQETVVPKAGRPSATYLKDPGFGSRLNFGVTFAPAFDWMYDHTVGYEKDGIVMGMRYGVNLNVNLTPRKNFYFSTGLFVEHCGGKMRFLDNIPVGSLGIADSTQTQRTYRSIYLTIPTMITMKTNSINNFYVCGNLGLMHSFNLKATQEDSYLLGDELWSREKKDSQEAALLKESFIAGVGFEYAVTPTMRAGVMINYVQGVTNYFKGKGKARNGLTHVDQRANLGYVEIALNINFF